MSMVILTLFQGNNNLVEGWAFVRFQFPAVSHEHFNLQVTATGNWRALITYNNRLVVWPCIPAEVVRVEIRKV